MRFVWIKLLLRLLVGSRIRYLFGVAFGFGWLGFWLVG